MLEDFIGGWCGTVPISILIWGFFHKGPKPPHPWEFLPTYILGGGVAVAVASAGIGRSPGLGEVGEFIFSIAIGVLVAGIVETARLGMRSPVG